MSDFDTITTTEATYSLERVDFSPSAIPIATDQVAWPGWQIVRQAFNQTDRIARMTQTAVGPVIPIERPESRRLAGLGRRIPGREPRLRRGCHPRHLSGSVGTSC